MPYERIPFAKHSSGGRHLKADGSRLVNFYPVATAAPEPDKKVPLILYGTPGYKKYAQIEPRDVNESDGTRVVDAADLVKGVYALRFIESPVYGNYLVGISNQFQFFWWEIPDNYDPYTDVSNLHEVPAADIRNFSTELDDAVNDQINLATDGRYVIFITRRRVLLFDLRAVAVIQPEPNRDALPVFGEIDAPIPEDLAEDMGDQDWVDCLWLDGFFILAAKNGQIFHSLLNSIQFQQLEFEFASSKPDEIIGLEKFQRFFYVFGTESVERWYNAGTTDFSFNRDNSFALEYGCAARKSIQANEVGIYFVSTNKIVYFISPSGQARISKEQVEYDLARCDIEKTTAVTYTEEGHLFYSMTLFFPDGTKKNWTHDQTVLLWHERTLTDIITMAEYKGQNYFGLEGNDHIFNLSLDWGMEDEAMISRKAISPIINTNQRRTTMQNFQIDIPSQDQHTETEKLSLVPLRTGGVLGRDIFGYQDYHTTPFYQNRSLFALVPPLIVNANPNGRLDNSYYGLFYRNVDGTNTYSARRGAGREGDRFTVIDANSAAESNVALPTPYIVEENTYLKHLYFNIDPGDGPDVYMEFAASNYTGGVTQTNGLRDDYLTRKTDENPFYWVIDIQGNNVHRDILVPIFANEEDTLTGNNDSEGPYRITIPDGQIRDVFEEALEAIKDETNVQYRVAIISPADVLNFRLPRVESDYHATLDSSAIIFNHGAGGLPDAQYGPGFHRMNPFEMVFGDSLMPHNQYTESAYDEVRVAILLSDDRPIDGRGSDVVATLKFNGTKFRAEGSGPRDIPGAFFLGVELTARNVAVNRSYTGNRILLNLYEAKFDSLREVYYWTADQIDAAELAAFRTFIGEEFSNVTSNAYLLGLNNKAERDWNLSAGTTTYAVPDRIKLFVSDDGTDTWTQIGAAEGVAVDDIRLKWNQLGQFRIGRNMRIDAETRSEIQLLGAYVEMDAGVD